MQKILALLALVITVSACAQLQQASLVGDQRELYAIHIHGNWCKTCNKIDEVVHEAGLYFKERENIEYIVFDETNSEDLKRTSKLAMDMGLHDVFEHERHTGEVLFLDKETHEVLTRLYGVDNLETYKKAAEDLLAGREVADIAAERKQYALSKPSVEEIKKAKLLVVDIHHDMCGGCAVTAPVFEEVAKDYAKKKKIVFMTFDLTNRETIAATRKMANEAGLIDIYNSHKHTGEVLFINNKKKEVRGSLVQETDKDKYRDLIKELT